MQRIKAQMSDQMYISLADKIIYNNGTIEELRTLVWEVLKNEKKNRNRFRLSCIGGILLLFVIAALFAPILLKNCFLCRTSKLLKIRGG